MRGTLRNFTTQDGINAATATPTAKKLRIESDDLFQGKSEIVIVHHNEEYSLRITRNSKLILTK